MDRFGGIETEDTDQDRFGGLAVAEVEPELRVPSSLISSPDGLQMPVLDDSLLPQHDPNYINRFGVPLEPPVSEPTWGTGFSEELKQNTGDIFRSGLGFISSTLRDAGTVASDPRAALTSLGRNIVPPIAENVPPTPNLAIPEEHPAYQAGEKFEAGLNELFPRRDDAGLDTSVREGLGQMASMLGAGGVAKGLGLGLTGATTAATTLGGVMEFDDAFRRARERKDDPDTAFAKAFGYATVASLIENRLGVGRVLRQLFPSASDAAKKLTALGVSKKIAGNFLAGGAEEGSQRFAQNWIVDEKPSLEGVMDEALPGAIVEGIVGLPGAGGGFRPTATRRSQPQVPPTLPTQEETITLPLLEEPTIVGEAPGVTAAEAETGLNERAPEADADLDIRSLAEQRPDTEEPLTQPGLTAGEITAVGFFPAVSEAQGLGEQAGVPTVQDVRNKRAQDEREAAQAKVQPTPEQRLAIAAPGGMQAVDYSPEDAKRYAELIAEQKELQKDDANVFNSKTGELTPAWLKNWNEFEKLRNRYNGMPPASVVAERAAEAEAKSEDQTRRGIGFLPRGTEGQGGIGFSEALPPTVETVRQQRADEARDSGLAPGEKTKESRGTWFKGKNPQETARMMQARADNFLEGRTDEEAITDLARIAGGDTSVQLDDQAYNFAIKDLLVRIYAKIESAKQNPVYQAQAWQQIDRLAELSKRLGSETARSLVSRNLAYKQIDWLMPVLAWRGVVQERWKKFLKIPEDKTVSDVLKETTPTPEEVADAVEEEVERNEAEQSAQSIIDKLAESQSDTLKWPKWKVDGVRETVKWYILGDIADGEFQATMNSLKVDPNTARVLLGVANREFVIRDGYRQRKTAEQKARRQNEAEMRTLRARAYIAFKMGTEAERTADSILNEFAKTQSDTPAWTPKVYNQVREVFNGFMRGDITEAEFRASLETVNIGGGKIGALLGVAKRELQTQEFYRQAKADEDLKKLVRDKDKISALFRKLALGEGINWRDMFLDNPRSTQAERRKFLFDKIKSDPKFASLSKEEKAELERSLSEAWERQRMGVFRQEFGKLIKLPRVEVEKTIKELMPELIRQANLGTLDDAAFLNAIAKKLGLPEISGEKSKKITELSQKAQKEPQGVRRNKVMEEMIQLLQSGSDISKMDLLRDTWYGSVLMRVGTMLNVLAGSYGTGASFAGLAALDRTLQLRPLQGMKILGQFIGGTIEGTLIADQIARKGAYHLLPDAEQRMVNLLSGKAGARFDNLEELLRRGNPLGVLAYTRRFMAALDYIGALGTRDAQVLYGALTRGDQESLDALDKRYDKAESKRAEQQARAEMGPKASRAEVMVRKREILEEGVAEEIKENAIQVGRRAAQNAEPRGIPGFIYRLTAKIPFFARATLGLAFMRSAMNMVQNASDYMPGIGAITAIRGKIGTLPENHPLHVFGMDIPVEERRMMLAAQVSSLGIGLITAAMFLGDDDDKEDGWEISGGWRGLSPKQKSQLMEMGERPNSIRFGKNSPWISFKQMPFAPPLAIVGTMRDEERFHAKDWDGQSTMDRLVPAWLTGWMYIRDISSLSGIAALFDGNSWNTQETPAKLTQKVSKFAAQSVGRAGAGYIPSVLREIDELGDTSLYRPSKEEMAGWWIRNIPFARRTVGPGPALNNFGEPIQLTPPPIKSWVGFGKDNDLYNTLGGLASEGIFLPEPGNTAKIVDDDGNYREMTEDEWYQFIKIRGPIFKAGFSEGQLEWLRDADKSQVVDWLKEHSNKSNDAARKELFPLTRIKSLRLTPPE